MIQAIIFDYGNVIARFDHKIFFNRIGAFSSLAQAELFNAVRTEANLIVEYESGRLSSEDFFANACERLRLSISESQFRKIFVNIFERIPATIQLIRQLKPHYKIGLLSNTNEWHYQAEMATLDILPLFDSVSLSFELGAMKPSERIYRDALAKLRLAPAECVYIDDVVEYVEKAEILGLNAIHYTSHERLVSSLSEVGIGARSVTTPDLERRSGNWKRSLFFLCWSHAFHFHYAYHWRHNRTGASPRFAAAQRHIARLGGVPQH
jgi:epoxide hydrolase-like predicted phosphatase